MGKNINLENLDQWVLEYNHEKINQLHCDIDQFDGLQKDIIRFAYNIVNGNLWSSIESSEFIKDLFEYDTLLNDESITVEDYFFNINQKIEELEENQENQMILLMCGITFLNLYVQINWTGGPEHQVPQLLGGEKRFKEIKQMLELDGETIYTKVAHPQLLYLARLCLVDNYQFLADGCRSSCWWSVRAMIYHQRSLDNITPTLKSAISERFQIVCRFYVDVDLDNDTAIDLAATAKLEQSLCFLHFKQTAKLLESIEQAANISQLTATLTGALGRRTRFQTFDTAQLIVDVTKHRETNQTTPKSTATATESPSEENNSMDVDDKPIDINDDNFKFQREVTNDDPTLLSRPKITEHKMDVSNLRIVDQAILLVNALALKAKNGANGANEEMTPYVHKALEYPNSWIVHSMGLLMKSRLEANSSKTAERAALQIQALVEQYNDKTTESASTALRLQYLYITDYPSRWDLEREVGERFVSVGAVATAYDIFERLEMWADAIKCLQFMGKNARSEELVRSRLEVDPTPELWCVLGDIKEDPELYLKGWELSRKRYSRAQRSLAHHYLARAQWQEAIDCYQVALTINPLFPNSWFSLGCAAMRLEKWDIATNAFSRCIALEPEEAEAYGNLAAVYMIQKKMDRAYVALQEGLKHRRENWKMWENFQHVCMVMKDYQSAIQCILQIFELNNKKVDLGVLQVLANFVVDDSPDRTGINGRRIEKPISEMFGKITSKLTNNSDVWRIYADYHKRLGNIEKSIDLQQRAVRCIESALTGWDIDKEKFDRVVAYLEVLIRLYLGQEPVNSTNIYSAKLKINGIMKKVELSFKETDTYKKLQSLLDEMELKVKSN
ncbi:tetratricopeptide repeat domain 27 [Heterostelium album PN500]|uniref:Tetratricopeptide repeat domain 27 n=1 Tax=Heterostelium pallidum (strain ATCC 26659 / Pp 5 / PN500) TaxID=670386 RepID=D3B8D7_HETP5|nr:tetratricopeptide repeat domain 27 [Heterostelium album PN500]EFA82305.1 tetratricopeptide repeat domain 27 [Heterostelium album PN500]|eukprot:XP_020434422.1 tetratricopeptide repeat domain 27 [Heterostelium album PN500]